MKRMVAFHVAFGLVWVGGLVWLGNGGVGGERKELKCRRVMVEEWGGGEWDLWVEEGEGPFTVWIEDRWPEEEK